MWGLLMIQRVLVLSRALCCGSLLLFGAACADQGPSPDTCSAVPISVTSGIEPTFSWTSGCLVEGLTVSRSGSGAIVWEAVSVNQTNNLASGVRYALTPAGAALTANRLEPLVAGTSYLVALFRTEGGRGSPIHAVGHSAFTPPAAAP